MKPLALGLAGLVFWTGLARGEDSVRFLGFEGAAPAPVVMPATFGNRTRTIHLAIDGRNGTGSIDADFLQVAGTLALPLQKNVELQTGVTLGQTTPLRLSLPFPAVQRRTEILVRFKLGQTALGDLRFEVFPDSTTKELLALFETKDETSRVQVFGSGRKLRDFLTQAHVSFTDAGEAVPDNFEPQRLYVGEFTDSASFQKIEDRSPDAAVLVFAPDDSLPPGVYLDRRKSGALGHVTAPLLDNLAADPRAQVSLIKIIHLLLTSNPPSL